MKAQRPFQQLRSIVVAAVLSGLAVPGMARPVKTWNHQELFQSADAVLVLAVLDIDRAQEKPATFGIADTYQAYRARCRVLGVLKGDAPPQEVSLLFFQHADGRPGFNGVIPAPFSRDQRLEFLAYLSRERSGGWVPVTGHENAGLSIKALMKNLDHKYLDLPPATPESRVGTQGPSAATGAAPSKPNILLIVSDDQGYADAGFNGCQDIPTPQLDRLARTGLRCTSGYVTHAFCSPSRAALLTGRYQQRFGHEFNPVYDPLDANEGLPLTEKLLPEFLKEAGYATGWVGKWHLGASPAHTPQARRFTENFGFIGGGHVFWNWKPNERQYTLPIERNGRPVEVTNHLTTVFGDEAGAFVKRHAREPWFLYLAFNAPHMPNQPTPERLARFAHLKPPQRAAYAAQVSLMDDAIGAVMDAVRHSGQEARTLVFFFSDNGGPITKGAPNGSRNTPLRGGKGDVYEGGVRVPFVVSWPGRLPSGKDYPWPVSSLDVFATALACADVPRPTDRKYDGVDLVPFLTGETHGAPHERLFWRYGVDQQWAMREGNWKLVRLKGKPDELYDLAADIGETQNLAEVKPEVIRRLVAKLEAWNGELKAPVFLGSSVKDEDWGPGGANQRNRPK